MRSGDFLESADLKRLRLFVYLIPVVGFFPALWALYRRQGDRAEQTVSRLAVTLALGWVLGSTVLSTGAEVTHALPLLVMSSLLTSGYFLSNLWLMLRLWRRKSLWLPGVSDLGDRLP